MPVSPEQGAQDGKTGLSPEFRRKVLVDVPRSGGNSGLKSR